MVGWWVGGMEGQGWCGMGQGQGVMVTAAARADGGGLLCMEAAKHAVFCALTAACF